MGCKSRLRRFLNRHCLAGQLLQLMMVRRQAADLWPRAAAGPPLAAEEEDPEVAKLLSCETSF